MQLMSVIMAREGVSFVLTGLVENICSGSLNPRKGSYGWWGRKDGIISQIIVPSSFLALISLFDIECTHLTVIAKPGYQAAVLYYC
jgi:hypothetical protein